MSKAVVPYIAGKKNILHFQKKFLSHNAIPEEHLEEKRYGINTLHDRLAIDQLL